MRMMKTTTQAVTRRISIARWLCFPVLFYGTLEKIRESSMIASGTRTLPNEAVGDLAKFSPAVFQKYIKQVILLEEKQIDD